MTLTRNWILWLIIALAVAGVILAMNLFGRSATEAGSALSPTSGEATVLLGTIAALQLGSKPPTIRLRSETANSIVIESPAAKFPPAVKEEGEQG